MRYYRCKCGALQAYGSMPPPQCDACEDCGSNLAETPGSHMEPKPHSYVAEEIMTDDGLKTITRCRWCGRTQREIEEALK